MRPGLSKFLLLLWKNFLIQLRHPLQTTTEILSPVIFAGLLVVLRSLIETHPHGSIYFKPFSLTMPVLKKLPQLTTIAWAPRNPHLEKIIKDVLAAIKADEDVQLQELSFENIESMRTDLKQNDTKLSATFAAIEFNDELSGDKELPSKIKICIRFPTELREAYGPTWHTDRLFPILQKPGPRHWELNEGGRPSYYYEGFLKLQQELSYSVIKQLKPAFDRKLTTITLQRYPYPPWTGDELLTVLKTFVGLVIMLSLVYTFMNMVKAITVEKEKQLKESMKIMGLPSWLHWLAWFVKSLIMLTLTMILLVIIMKVNWSQNSNHTIFPHSNPCILFIFLIFFSFATITYSFAISSCFSQASTASSVAGVAWFITYFPYLLLQDTYNYLTLSEKLLLSFCSNSAMAIGFNLIVVLEGIGEGVQWHNMWTSQNPDEVIVLGHVLMMLTIDAIVYLLITLYIEAVCPGNFGIPKPWHFPVTSLFSKKHQYVEVTEDEDNINLNEELYEAEPTNLNIGVKIQRLGKVFSNNKTAVRNLSLNMYENQITVLLGHNGAGKTTTMSMLTGMIPPTSGRAIIGGYDIRRDMSSVRKSLGLCPQHNILFDELTVKEHFYFYGKLKGLTEMEVQEEVDEYVKLLDLKPKINALSSTLSGGMKRKLSVGIALSGGSRVIMLDEPSAGMDPTARRALWDFLLQQKQGRTILLTTHYMDEADLLGDRIAIMTGGRLQCCGSSFFLKKKYGAGYHLILDKAQGCQVHRVTRLLKNYIPKIKVENNIGSELTYLLREDQSSVFELMLKDLEDNFEELGILSYGISLTTLEEVFMKAGSENVEVDGVVINAYDKLRTSMDTITIESQSLYSEQRSRSIVGYEPKLKTGCTQWYYQVFAMFMKRGLSILRSRMIYLLQLFIPILYIFFAISVIRFGNMSSDLPEREITLKMYGDVVTPVTTNSDNKYCDHFKKLASQEGSLADWGNGDFSNNIIKETERREKLVRLKYIVGAAFASNSIKIWFNNQPFHAPPVGLQLVINSILQVEVSKDNHIQISNYPLPRSLYKQLATIDQHPENSVGFHMAFYIGFAMTVVSPFYLMFYVRERACKSKHLQFVSGVYVLIFWTCSFICDLLTFIVICFVVVFTLLAFQEDGFKTYTQLEHIFLILIYFAFAIMPVMYLCSFIFHIPATGYSKIALLNIFIGMAGFILVQILRVPWLDLKYAADITHWNFLVIPHYALTSAINDLYLFDAFTAVCQAAINDCLNTPPHVLETQAQCEQLICKSTPMCCKMPKNYYDWKEPGIGRNITFLILLGFISIVLLLIIEFKICKIISDAFNGWINYVPPVIDPWEDVDVRKERQKIYAMPMGKMKEYTLLMKNVVKFYKNFVAVNNISLAVTRYECFGLLGINGAGKTTTFKILTGDTKMTFGNAWVNGFNLKTKMKTVQQLIGYCPQFDALLDDLTCRETMRIYCLIRGISWKESKVIADGLAQEFDFIPHLNKKVKELSGGNKRKLSTAITLIGNPTIIYLDEPTAGMDPATRRYLWNSLCKVRDNGTCIVLTSHSMEECEALCTRLAIMVNGKFKCLGSTQHLKSKFSEGYTLTIKLKKEPERSSSSLSVAEDTMSRLEDSMARVEEFVKKSFIGALKREQYQELVTYYIADKSLPWSRMFGIMEAGKKNLNIEDYSLGQCSLEQVFLLFTKYQRRE